MVIKVKSIKEKQDEEKIYILELERGEEKRKDRFEVRLQYKQDEKEWALYPTSSATQNFVAAELEAILKVIQELNEN